MLPHRCTSKPLREDITFSRFQGRLKQLAFVDLKEDDRTFIDVCFPEFARLGRANEPLKQSFGIKYRMSRTNTVPIDFGRLRRFSGGPSLGRGRYWSVCHDETGQDGGTLISELMAYWQSSTGYLPNLRDAGLQLERGTTSAEPIRVLEVIADRFEDRGVLRRRTTRVDRVYRLLRLAIAEVEVERVVDLRLPETQRWFFANFVGLEDRSAERGHLDKTGSGSLAIGKTRPIHDFLELLPTLVADHVGGGAFHQAVGAWLRHQGANALVYPSARRDAMTTLDGSRLIFDGWNFVDYRDAGPPHDWEPLFGRLPQWLRPDSIGIEIVREEAPGWAIRGAERRQRAEYDLHRREFPTTGPPAFPDW
jgi:hypothetical protein